MEMRFSSAEALNRRDNAPATRAARASQKETRPPRTRGRPKDWATRGMVFLRVPSCPWWLTFMPLIQRINGQAAQQLGIEIRRLLRQDLTGKCNVAHLFHANRVHEKGDIGAARPDSIESFCCFAHITDVLLIANRLL